MLPSFTFAPRIPTSNDIMRLPDKSFVFHRKAGDTGWIRNRPRNLPSTNDKQRPTVSCFEHIRGTHIQNVCLELVHFFVGAWDSSGFDLRALLRVSIVPVRNTRKARTAMNTIASTTYQRISRPKMENKSRRVAHITIIIAYTSCTSCYRTGPSRWRNSFPALSRQRTCTGPSMCEVHVS